ncbi:MAG: hypothetical protein KDB68_07705 [Planctomycetes bacterium]|nr:hypothetical protein [Planctomycetota bacterium]MCA8946644.1 hypothetical protein [Planctomycetota bacterium]
MLANVEIVHRSAFTPQGFDYELFERLCDSTVDFSVDRSFDWGDESLQVAYLGASWLAATVSLPDSPPLRTSHYYATTKALMAENAVRPLGLVDFAFPTTIVSNACVSGAQAVIEAIDALNDGDCDVAVVTASDVITSFADDGFKSLQALATTCALPFDRRRTGLTLSSAYAEVILTRDEGREPRIISYGCSNDANHISGPSQDGSGLALAIERALDGIDKSEIQAICAHGTATVYNDAMEARAFHTVFNGNPPPVFGIKGAIGHTLGAAGLIEVIVSAKVSTEGLIPPTVGFEQGEDEYPLDIVHGEPRRIEPGYVLTTNSGFGGMNTAIVVGPGAV